MRYAFVADIHGNLDAFQAVLAEIDDLRVDQILCLGDLVGYGAQPAACIALARERGIPCIAGNHDLAVTGDVTMDYFNPTARASALWTRQVLSDEELSFLSSCPLERRNECFALVHGDPADPIAFEYVLTPADAARAFALMDRPLLVLGHSHVPLAFLLKDETLALTGEQCLRLDSETAAIVNAGSVGQPRDGNAAASFALLDTESSIVEIRRVDYDIRAAADRILAAGLPESNAYRLFSGQ